MPPYNSHSSFSDCLRQWMTDEVGSGERPEAGHPGYLPSALLDVNRAIDQHDELIALSIIQSLWMDPIQSLGGREVLQFHPETIAIKNELESRYIRHLEELTDASGAEESLEFGRIGSGADAAVALRRIAHLDLVPSVYEWIADEADWPQMVAFLALEGGPDAGFDDLVALAQVGLRGRPKMALGRNYWDEMGRGELREVHTVLHDEMVQAARLPRVAEDSITQAGLRRIDLCGVLATNRALQPELLGALGLIELQAGPRCRAVVRGLRRVEAPEGTLPFYEEHAEADPVHGKDWLDSAIVPLVDENPEWGPRIVRGALWRHVVNYDFFSEVRQTVNAMMLAVS